MSDDLSYLDLSFNAQKLTKAQLRSVLAENGVTDLPPASAKKEVLIGLFEEHVRGKAGDIRRAKRGVKASAKGIAFLDNQSHPSSSASPIATPKLSPRRSRSRSASKSPIKGERNNVLKEIVSTESVDYRKPRGRPRKVETEPKAKTKGRSRSVVRRCPETPSISSGHQIMGTPLKDLQSSLPARTDSPASATVKLQRRLGYIASANNMALAQEAIQPVYADSPSRMKGLRGRPLAAKLATKFFSFFLGLVKFLFIFSVTIFVAVYLRWKYVYPIPYCDTNLAPKPFFPEVDLMTSLKTLCLACPEHGKCHNGKLVCDDGHLRVSNWLWFGEHCQTDWKRFSKAEDLLKAIKLVLRERQGSFQCKLCASPTLTEPMLKSFLRSTRFNRASWSGEDFDSYYRLAMADLLKDPETPQHGIKVLGGSGEGHQRLFLSSVAKLSWRCQLYLLANHFIEKYRNHIFIAAALIALAIYMYIKWRVSSWERRKVDELVQTVLQCLAEQDALNRRDPTRPSTLSVPQLRDALFMNAPLRDKTRLWPKVCAAIANNSNVRESVMSIKGEQHRVWEWIGMDVLAPFTRPQQQ